MDIYLTLKSHPENKFFLNPKTIRPTQNVWGLAGLSIILYLWTVLQYSTQQLLKCKIMQHIQYIPMIDYFAARLEMNYNDVAITMINSSMFKP